jgi:large subunit ribosomal protein L24
MLVKEGDNVVVIAGNSRNTTQARRVLRVDREADKVVVEGVGLVRKHVRRSQKYPQGGRLSHEMPIAASNVLYFCASCNKGVRLGVRYLEDGSKERFCKKCGTGAGQIAPAKSKYAKKK